jgi:hypothetical protein
VFNTILGIPAHPLLIHAAVVFIPLLVVGAIVYAAWPPYHARITWAVLALAVVAPFAALFAKLSGQDLRNQLIARHLTSPELLGKIAVHNSYGNKAFWWTLALGIITLALLAYYRRAGTSSTAVRAGATAVTVIVGAIVGYYVFKTGDTGAHIVWQGL